MQNEAITNLLAQFREIFTADGGDLALKYCDDTKVVLQILVGPATCRDCIMEASSVEGIFRENLEAQLGHPVNVQVEMVETAGEIQ
jgi:Fe-S cluster biogenesis protein NfuA